MDTNEVSVFFNDPYPHLSLLSSLLSLASFATLVFKEGRDHWCGLISVRHQVWWASSLAVVRSLRTSLLSFHCPLLSHQAPLKHQCPWGTKELIGTHIPLCQTGNGSQSGVACAPVSYKFHSSSFCKVQIWEYSGADGELKFCDSCQLFLFPEDDPVTAWIFCASLLFYLNELFYF